MGATSKKETFAHFAIVELQCVSICFTWKKKKQNKKTHFLWRLWLHKKGGALTVLLHIGLGTQSCLFSLVNITHHCVLCPLIDQAWHAFDLWPSFSLIFAPFRPQTCTLNCRKRKLRNALSLNTALSATMRWEPETNRQFDGGFRNSQLTKG